MKKKGFAGKKMDSNENNLEGGYNGKKIIFPKPNQSIK